MYGDNQQPYGYNPFMDGMRQRTQQTQQNVMPSMWGYYNPGNYQQDQGMGNDFWITVRSIDEARNAFVKPGEQKWFVIPEKMLIAVKSVSKQGVMDFQPFLLVPYAEQQEQQTYAEQQNQGTGGKSTIEELMKKMQEVLDKVNTLEGTVEEMKGERDNGKSVKQVSGSAAKSGSR